MIAEQFVNGLVFALSYFLFAVTFLPQFGILRIPNLAFGEVLTASAMVGVATATAVGGGASVSLVTAAIVASALGSAVHFIGVRPLGDVTNPQSPSHLTCLISTMGCGLLIQNTLIFKWGGNPVPFPRFTEKNVFISGVQIQATTLFLFAFVVAIGGGLIALLHNSVFGVKLRSIAEDRRLAAATGVNVPQIEITAIVASYFCAGLAACFVFQQNGWVSPFVGLGYSLKAMIVLVLAGRDRIGLLLPIAVIVGLLEAYTVGFISSGYRDAVAFGALLLFVTLRTHLFRQKVAF